MDPISLSTVNLQFLPEWAKKPSAKPLDVIEGVKKTSHPNKPFRKERAQFSGKTRPRQRENNRKADGLKRDHFIQSKDARSISLDVKISFLPEPKALESVIKQIRDSARAYPLFSLAKMFLDKPDRHYVRLQSVQAGGSLKPIFQCTICSHAFLKEAEAMTHVLKEHGSLFYQEERHQAEMPKGNFTSVARCTLNGAILGPTNHHAYQVNLMRLYRTQFAHIPFERFKQNVISVHDPEVVEKWKEGAAWKITYKSLQASEPESLNSDAEVELHFQRAHFSSVIHIGQEFIVEGEVSRRLEQPQLRAAIRTTWESEISFPSSLAGRLREDFFKNGLYVFKRRKGMQFASLVRPRSLVAEAGRVSEDILSILQWIKTHPKCKRENLFGDNSATHSGDSLSLPKTDKMLQNLYWLIRQGHVIEYYDGVLDLVSHASAESKPL